MPSRKMVSLTEETYKSLAREGTLEDTFDTGIQRLIRESKKVAASGVTLAGTNQIAATAPQPSTSKGDSHSNV